MDIQRVVQAYQELTKSNIALLGHIYHSNVVFKDPVHKIEGWEELERYFDSLYQNVISCSFDIHHAQQTENQGFLVWTMRLQHPKLRRGQEITVEGMSWLQFSDHKVIVQQDAYDLGEMIYEHIPLLGHVVRKVKQGLAQ